MYNNVNNSVGRMKLASCEQIMVVILMMSGIQGWIFVGSVRKEISNVNIFCCFKRGHDSKDAACVWNVEVFLSRLSKWVEYHEKFR